MLVSVDGELVEERYFNGARSTESANLKSASKSVLSTLVGIAVDRGQLKSLSDPIIKFFPEHFGATTDAAKKRITIEDLLTMRSGLESTSNVNYGRWVASDNWVRHILTRPLIDEPGGGMIYSTGNSHLLSAILTKATKMSTFEFARRYLADPLGIALRPWIRDPQGIYLGGNDMHLTPRAMLEYGELYLNRGRVLEKQIVSEHWIAENLLSRAPNRAGAAATMAMAGGSTVCVDSRLITRGDTAVNLSSPCLVSTSQQLQHRYRRPAKVDGSISGPSMI